MALNIEETFHVQSSTDKVWAFLTNPEDYLTCLPGATLIEKYDERSFMGSVRVKIGPVMTNYKGKFHFKEIDPESHTLLIIAEGMEQGGTGSAKALLKSQLTALEGQTEVKVLAEVELTGKIVQFGRGMIAEVSKQLFKQFAECVKNQLQQPEEEKVATSKTQVESQQALSAIHLFLKTIEETIKKLLKKLFNK